MRVIEPPVVSIRSRSIGSNQSSSFGAQTTWAGLLELRRVWNRSAAQPLRQHPFLSNSAASPNSILPAVLASEPRTVRELCNLYNLDGGFSGGTTGSISTSRRPRRDSPVRLQGCCVSSGGDRSSERRTYYGTQSGWMCPSHGLIRSRLKARCLECGKPFTRVVYSTSKK